MTESFASRRRVAKVYAWLLVAYVGFRLWTLTRARGVGELTLGAFSLLVEVTLALSALRLLRLVTASRDRSGEATAMSRYWIERGEPEPLIDVFIPTYNELEAILERTIIAALAQSHGNFRVWVLDDGARPWLAALCERHGARYLTRAERSGAKAGNLNAALARLKALGQAPEFVAVLDADFVAQPRLLERCVALMHDATVGLVQTPQAFYNLDNFQNSLAPFATLPDALRFTYDVLLPARDAASSGYCCGTSFLIRVSALERIGGFPSASVSEDLLLSHELSRSSIRSVYLAEPLSFGVATEGLGEYLMQRARWALGYAQVVRLLWKRPGKTLWQRLQAAETALRVVYTATARLAFVAIPITYFALGWRPIPAPSWAIFGFALPLLGCNRWTLYRISDGRQLPFYFDAVSLVGAVVATRAAIAGFVGRLGRPFVVTDKGAERTERRIHGSTLLWVAPLLTLNLGGLVRASAAVVNGGAREPELWAMLAWSAAAAFTLTICALFSVERPRFRAEERIDAHLMPTRLRSAGAGMQQSGLLLDVSTLGARVRTDAAHGLWPGAACELTLGDDWVPARCIRTLDATTLAVRLEPHAAQRTSLIRHVYTGGYIRPIRSGSLSELARGVLLRLWRSSPTRPAAAPSAANARESELAIEGR
jgi:cellulose synthase (UDP-forming)